MSQGERASEKHAIRKTVPQETTRPFVCGLFLFPITSEFAFSHYRGGRDKGLWLTCESSSSHPNCYYSCRKAAFSALKPLNYLLSSCGLHLPIFCSSFSMITGKGSSSILLFLFLASCPLEFLLRRRKFYLDFMEGNYK